MKCYSGDVFIGLDAEVLAIAIAMCLCLPDSLATQ